MFDDIDLFGFLPRKVQTGCLIFTLLFVIGIVVYFEFMTPG